MKTRRVAPAESQLHHIRTAFAALIIRAQSLREFVRSEALDLEFKGHP